MTRTENSAGTQSQGTVDSIETSEEGEDDTNGASHPIDEYISKHERDGRRTTPISSAHENTRQEHEEKKKEIKPEPMKTIKSRGLSLPPPLTSLDAVPEKQPEDVIIVHADEDMMTSAEFRKFSRPVRYFDEDVGGGATCFKCGQVGHIARDCPNPPKLRPCYLCAGFGHSSSKCPNASCFRCGEVGHQARDCLADVERWDSSSPGVVCRRCGRAECRAAGAADILRAEGQCNMQYIDSDLQMVECLSCGRRGHANCMPLAQSKASPSCFNCGEGGHIGFECRRGPTTAVFSERKRAYTRTHTRAHTRKPVPMKRDLGVVNTWTKRHPRRMDEGKMRLWRR